MNELSYGLLLKGSIKTVCIAALCLAAVACTASSAVFAADGGAVIRIGLSYGSGAPASCEISSANGFILGVYEKGGFREGMPLPAYTTLTVSASGGRTTLHAGGVLVSDDVGAGNCIMPYDYAAGAPIVYNGVPYRGGLSFRSNSNNTFNVINRLTVEEYLYGVINSEMGYKNPGEALKAQAVAARSYAILKTDSHASDGFDMCAAAHCQVYKGYGDEHAETSAAVDGTAGLALYSGGVPVSGNYFKNSGGHTQNAEDVWNSAEAHLRGVLDEYSPPYTWGWQLSFRELRTLIASAGDDPGDISSISVSERTVNGHVLAVSITGERGVVTLEKNRIRTVLGASNVKSLNFTFGGAPPTPARPQSVHVAVGGGVQELSGGMSVLSANGFAVTVNMADAVIQGASERVKASGSDGSLAGAFPPEGETATGGSVTFTGSGYGHGVGMPQDSAIEMANQGFDFRQILTKYFTGTEIR
ncbi:MAG: SpoIID/LytB domain-containing protein [Clostridiales Family XIII bacterium]|nr:SpoIID/LytB domain-containing protein [Clostridiales Family XIII bacterium]